MASVNELLADLLGGQPAAADEAPADEDAAADDAEDAAADDAEGDDADDEDADAGGEGEDAGDEAGGSDDGDEAAERPRCINRNEHVGNLRSPSKVEKRQRHDRGGEAQRERSEDEADDGGEQRAERPARDDDDEAPARRNNERPANNNSGGSSGGDAVDLSGVEREVFDLLNAERRNAGLAPLELDSSLSQGSRAWSRRMATENFFSHDTSGNFAENIAYGYPNAAAVHRGWMESEGHRNNRMNSRYTTYGVGVHQQGNTLYYTERFR